MGQKRNACRVFVGKPQRNRAVGRSRLRKGNNSKINSKVIEFWCLAFVCPDVKRDK